MPDVVHDTEHEEQEHCKKGEGNSSCYYFHGNVPLGPDCFSFSCSLAFLEFIYCQSDGRLDDPERLYYADDSGSGYSSDAYMPCIFPEYLVCGHFSDCLSYS